MEKLWQVQLKGPEVAPAAKPYKPPRNLWQDSSSLYQLAAHEHFYSLLQQPEREPG